MGVLRDALAGLAGGLAGGAVQSHLVPRLLPVAPSPPEGRGEEHETADMRAARLFWQDLLGRQIPEHREAFAASLAHYALAGGIGAVYGVLAGRIDGASAGRGAALGVASWALGDELASPLLGLAEAPQRYPPSTHVYGLVSNVEYGMTTEAVRRVLASPSTPPTQGNA